MSDQPASGHREPEDRDTVPHESTGAHSCAKANSLLGMKREKWCVGEAASLLQVVPFRGSVGKCSSGYPPRKMRARNRG